MITITPLDQNPIDSESFYQKPRTSKFQSFNKFSEKIDFSDTGTVYDFPLSFTEQSKSSEHFNQSQSSIRITRTNYHLRPQPRKNHSSSTTFDSR